MRDAFETFGDSVILIFCKHFSDKGTKIDVVFNSLLPETIFDVSFLSFGNGLEYINRRISYIYSYKIQNLLDYMIYCVQCYLFY